MKKKLKIKLCNKKEKQSLIELVKEKRNVQTNNDLSNNLITDEKNKNLTTFIKILYWIFELNRM